MDLQSYSPHVFQQLPDFFESRDRLALLESKIQALGDVICAHGLHDVFGVALLHKHFDLGQDEILVRRYLSATSSVMEAERLDPAGSDMFPYLWQHQPGINGAGFYPLEFAAYTTEADVRRYRAHMRHLGMKGRFLEDFQNKAEDLELDGLVALAGLHAVKAFRIGRSQTLLELTDEVGRHITLDVVTSQQVTNAGSTTKTLWIFTPSVETINAGRCATHCYAHCHAHKREVSEKEG